MTCCVGVGLLVCGVTFATEAEFCLGCGVASLFQSLVLASLVQAVVVLLSVGFVQLSFVQGISFSFVQDCAGVEFTGGGFELDFGVDFGGFVFLGRESFCLLLAPRFDD